MSKYSYVPKRRLLFGMTLFILFMIGITAIFLAATIFRSQIPFFRLWDNVPGSVWQEKPITLPGVQDLDNQNNVKLYLLLGSDYRPEAGFRTDVILLVALNPATGRVSLVSFPRDLWVTIPGVGEQRINTVMQTGGFPLLAETLYVNFGVYPTDYAMVDMAGFLEMIDVLGGITIDTEYATADACDTSLDPDGWCEVGPGQVDLDSAWALWYVRARYNSSDFDRMRRTQEVVKAIVKKAVGLPGLINSMEILQVYSEKVETNIASNAILPLLQSINNITDPLSIKQFSIGPEQTTAMVTAQGAAILLPDTAAIQLILNDALLWVSP